MQFNENDINSQPGTYALVFYSPAIFSVEVGRLGVLDFKKGYYVYVGSAFGPGGISARLNRHLRIKKKKHWHLDYIRQYLKPADVWYSYDTQSLEHLWAEIISKNNKCTSSIKKFGCSDCKCESHLFYFRHYPTSDILS